MQANQILSDASCEISNIEIKVRGPILYQTLKDYLSNTKLEHSEYQEVDSASSLTEENLRAKSISSLE